MILARGSRCGSSGLRLASLERPGELPDVASAPPAGGSSAPIDRSGMRRIEVAARVVGADGLERLTSAMADASVNLVDRKARGIHMSRLLLGLSELLEQHRLDLALVAGALAALRDSHEGVSDGAWLRIELDWLARREALVSGRHAWRSYPVALAGSLDASGLRLFLEVKVAYSSTCPCSAALARQLIQGAFDRDFGGSGAVPFEQVHAWLGTERAICATPHSQRSEATVRVRVASALESPTIDELLESVEEALGTPVQGAVKREDEQEFALLNGQNTMFCEDAARRIRDRLDPDARIADYRVECAHFESLHPHDAVSVVVKGVPGGLTP